MEVVHPITLVFALMCVTFSEEFTSVIGSIECMNGRFACANGLSCIPDNFLCDGGRDCSDGSDETGCENGLLCKKKKCDQLCELKTKAVHVGRQRTTSRWVYDRPIEEPSKPGFDDDSFEEVPSKPGIDDGSFEVVPSKRKREAVCKCFKGYKLTIDGSMKCVDIDECASGACQQKCENTPGSFRCSCVDGYKVGRDNTSCEVGGVYPVLMYSTYHDLYLDLIGTQRRYNIPLSSRDTVLDTAYFEDTSEVYWLQTFLNKGYVRKAAINGSQTNSTVLHKEFINPEGLAIDWLNKRLYITDRGQSRIESCDMNANQCVIVMNEVEMLPTAIVLDVMKGEMYWINDGLTSQLFTSGMDGSLKNEISLSIESRLSDIAIDHATRQLYWSVPDSSFVFYISLDNHNEKPSNFQVQRNIVKMFVFGDLLYYTTKDSGKLSIISKRTRTKHSFIATTSNNTPIVDIAVYHPILHHRENSAGNPCDANSCSHVCLLAPNLTSSCFCFHDFELAVDGLSCNKRIPLTNV